MSPIAVIHQHHHLLLHSHQDGIMFKGPWRAIDAIPCKPPQGDTGSLWRTGPPFFENTFKKKDLCFTALDSLSFASKSVDSRESRGFGIMGISAGEKMTSHSTFWSSHFCFPCVFNTLRRFACQRTSLTHLPHDSSTCQTSSKGKIHQLQYLNCFKDTGPSM